MTIPGNSADCIAWRLLLEGRVQGFGVRPAVARLACKLGLVGTVANRIDGLEIVIEGSPDQVRRFRECLPDSMPSLACIDRIDSAPIGIQGLDRFKILAKDRAEKRRDLPGGGSQRPLGISAQVPQDLAVCSGCLAELRSSGDRRFGYPFISCTDCGPRFSIIDRMPYERDNTAMSSFALCNRCRSEYESPADRRFHSQTNACPDCGPTIWIVDRGKKVVARKQDAIACAAKAIQENRIVGLRGLGGYQLLANATSNPAVLDLRTRKQRRGKPLAVMVDSIGTAESIGKLTDAERGLLCSSAAPIVVVRRRSGGGIANSIHNGLDTIGIMMPTTPLHWLLSDRAGVPLVCTSGNIEGDPIATTADDLSGLADLIVEHDREILRPIDDSVVRVIAGRTALIRCARGYGPLVLDSSSWDALAEQTHALVATGGHQKSSIALWNGAQAVLGPHLGDLESQASRDRYVQQVLRMQSLYGLPDATWIHDSHPEYFSTQWSRQKSGVRTIGIQHHHAHVVSGMIQPKWLDRKVLGVAFDGTGLGTDGTVWGGEFLIADRRSFQRVGHLRPFRLVGGTMAIGQPWRVAAALVADAIGFKEASELDFSGCDVRSIIGLLDRKRFSTVTTSAGRLFDGVAALILGIQECQFEGQAAMMLEAISEPEEAGAYTINLSGRPVIELDWRPLIREVMADRLAGETPGKMAARFHRGLADAIEKMSRCHPDLPVVLSGGVFQNQVLVEQVQQRMDAANRPLGSPGWVPVNDGGLAAGQLIIGAATISSPGE